MSVRLKKHRSKDSTLAYYVNQLENLDKRFYEPLFNVTWGRDIKLRSGITFGDEASSFIQQAFAAPGTLKNASGANGGNMPWVGAETTALPGVDVNGKKITATIRLLAREISYTSVELDRSQRTGQSIDVTKINAFNSLYQMNTDQMVYIGSTDVGVTGLLNSALVTSATVANGFAGSPLWTSKTADEIVADVNTLLNASWAASGYAVCPEELRLPPAQFSYIASQKVSSAGNVSILKYIQDNSISLQINGKALNIQPIKWLVGRGSLGTDRMMCYTNREEFVRFVMVPVRRETPYYQGIRFTAPYIWAYGENEFVYPETVRYADGI